MDEYNTNCSPEPKDTEDNPMVDHDKLVIVRQTLLKPPRDPVCLGPWAKKYALGCRS
jgi:hypothetical protein